MSTTTAAANTPSNPADGEQVLRLDGELSIYRATELKPLMLAVLDRAPAASTPEFDLSAVTEIDTAGVQLLLLVRREASLRGMSLELRAASPAVRNAFELIELDNHLAAA